MARNTEALKKEYNTTVPLWVINIEQSDLEPLPIFKRDDKVGSVVVSF